MFNNVGFKIKIVATVLTIIVVACLAVGAVASGVLLISGHGSDLSLKVLIISVGGGAVIYFFSLLLFGFGHIIDLTEEQTVLLRRIAEDEVSGYDKMNNNVFVE